MATRSAMRRPARWRRSMMSLWLLLAATPLAGCGAFLTETPPDVAGGAGAGIAGAVSKDATVGAAIGLGVASVASAGLQLAERRVHRTEQDRIAEVAGGLPDGVVATWSVTHTVPIEPSERGELVVSRSIGGADFACKEVVFSVDGGSAAAPERAFYIAMVCRDGDHWKWATAEPATGRWGSIQ